LIHLHFVVSNVTHPQFFQSFHILRSGLRHFCSSPRPADKVKTNLESVLSIVKSPDVSSLDSQLDGLLSALSGLSVEADDSKPGGGAGPPRLDSTGSSTSAGSGSGSLSGGSSDASSVSVSGFSVGDPGDEAMSES
jgi:hypothetical protein